MLRPAGLCICHPLARVEDSVRPQKPLAVQMDHMGRRFCNPDLCFPCNVAQILDHGFTGEKRGHEDEAGARCSKQDAEFNFAFGLMDRVM